MARGLNRVVVAPDKFKGTLTAAQVAAHVAAGWNASAPDCRPSRCLSRTAEMARWTRR